MTCVYSEYIGATTRDGIEYAGARCPHCQDQVWFPALARDRRKQGACLADPPSPVVAPVSADDSDRDGNQTDLFGKKV